MGPQLGLRPQRRPEGLQTPLHAHFQPLGNTDSEHAFCWIMQELSSPTPACPHRRAHDTLRELAARIAPHGTFNFLLSNGQASGPMPRPVCYIERRHPFSQAQLCDEDMQVDFSRLTTPRTRSPSSSPR
jgi:glutamine amidotransferase